MARSERQRFEVVIYNKEVRSLVESNQSHKDLKDDWAENHYQEVFASSAEEARRKTEIRYPARKGFVIADVHPITAYDGDEPPPPKRLSDKPD